MYAVNLVAALHFVLRVLGVLRGALLLRISHCMYYCACCIAASQIRWGNKFRCVVRSVLRGVRGLRTVAAAEAWTRAKLCSNTRSPAQTVRRTVALRLKH